MKVLFSKAGLFVHLASVSLVATCLFSVAIAQTPVHTGAIVLARNASGVSISVDDVLSQIQQGSAAEQKAFLAKPESVQMLAQNLLVRRVLAAQAQANGLLREPLVAAKLVVASDQVLSDTILARLDSKNEPNEAALEAYARSVYQVNSSKYEIPPKTRARHILLPACGPDSIARAKGLLGQLRAGASFEDLAKTNSIDKASAHKGGDLGFFVASNMTKPFDEALDALVNPGDLSEPVLSQFGYHIIRLEERQPKGMQSFESVRSKLMAEARQSILMEARSQKAQNVIKDFVFDTAAIEAMSTSANTP